MEARIFLPGRGATFAGMWSKAVTTTLILSDDCFLYTSRTCPTKILDETGIEFDRYQQLSYHFHACIKNDLLRSLQVGLSCLVANLLSDDLRHLVIREL